jgi:hypothetical protein
MQLETKRLLEYQLKDINSYIDALEQKGLDESAQTARVIRQSIVQFLDDPNKLNYLD